MTIDLGELHIVSSAVMAEELALKPGFWRNRVS
jgi:hypothetical protein